MEDQAHDEVSRECEAVPSTRATSCYNTPMTARKHMEAKKDQFVSTCIDFVEAASNYC